MQRQRSPERRAVITMKEWRTHEQSVKGLCNRPRMKNRQTGTVTIIFCRPGCQWPSFTLVLTRAAHLPPSHLLHVPIQLRNQPLCLTDDWFPSLASSPSKLRRVYSQANTPFLFTMHDHDEPSMETFDSLPGVANILRSENHRQGCHSHSSKIAVGSPHQPKSEAPMRETVHMGASSANEPPRSNGGKWRKRTGIMCPAFQVFAHRLGFRRLHSIINRA